MLFKNFLLLICFVSFWTQSNDEAISWNEDLKLTWNQFRGKPNPSISAAAVTASGITFEFSVKETDTRVMDFSTKVFAHFYPDKSWYVKDRADARILAHEQLHFDITELHVRKFRKKISELKVNNNIKSQLRLLHQEMNQELAETQKRYDAETDSSRNFEAQAAWHVFVLKEMDKYKSYQSKG